MAHLFPLTRPPKGRLLRIGVDNQARPTSAPRTGYDRQHESRALTEGVAHGARYPRAGLVARRGEGETRCLRRSPGLSFDQAYPKTDGRGTSIVAVGVIDAKPLDLTRSVAGIELIHGRALSVELARRRWPALHTAAGFAPLFPAQWRCRSPFPFHTASILLTKYTDLAYCVGIT
jgi:hypothetical protein